MTMRLTRFGLFDGFRIRGVPVEDVGRVRPYGRGRRFWERALFGGDLSSEEALAFALAASAPGGRGGIRYFVCLRLVGTVPREL